MKTRRLFSRRVFKAKHIVLKSLIIVILALCTTVSMIGQQSKTAQKTFLSDKLQKILEKYPYIQSISQKPAQAQNSLLNYNNTLTALNMATLCYICHELYREYRMYSYALEHQTEPDSLIERFIVHHINLLFPNLEITFGLHFTFFIRAASIIILAMLYKTLAKLVLMAWHGDLFDFISSMIVHRSLT